MLGVNYFSILAAMDKTLLGIIALVIFLSFLIVILSIVLPVAIVRRKYRNFVIKHSLALKQLDEINKKYQFLWIPNFDMKHSYDNERFFNDISPKDFLTYQLVYIQKKVNLALKNTLDNKSKFDTYKKAINDCCELDKFDTNELLKNRKRLAKYENRLFKQKIQNPTINFSIIVCLNLTTINGAHRTFKSGIFSPVEIKEIINKLNQKRDNFYIDEDTWRAICRVERGKVTNKMRFAVYQRDGYRCRKCHRKTNDLEVDHIYPVAKGGKSTFDNLQTLCHRCNVKKGSNIE